MNRDQNFRMNIPRMIKDLKRFYTKADIAKIVDATWPTVNLWEKGAFKPSTMHLGKLIKLYIENHERKQNEKPTVTKE